MRPIAIPLVCAALVAACGCVNHQQILQELADGPQRPDRYELGARDTVLFEYRMNPELNRQLTIGPHGKVHLPMVGEVLVAGKTPPELSQELTDLYSKHLTTPDVYVTLVGFGSKTVYVFGEVGRAGPQIYDRPLRMIDVIAQAGGPTLRAQQTNIRLTRPSYDDPLTVEVDLRKLIDQGQMLHNPVLMDQDIVFVPPTFCTAVGYAVNEVLFPVTSIFTGVEQGSSATSTLKTFGQQGLGR